jgi:phage baseplate assembly protein gpV
VTDLADMIVRMNREIAELRRRQSQMLRRGTVHALRKGGNELQIKLGDDPEGNPILTPWLPVSGGNGNGAKTRHAYTVGEHVMLHNPDGDWEAAEVTPSNHHQGGPSPSSVEGEHVIHDGGGIRIVVSGGKLTITGGSIEHDGKNIGKDHKHTGVEAGSAQTGDPA